MPEATSSAAALQPLAEAQGASRAALTAQALAIATTATRSFDGWYETARIRTWSAGMAQSIETILRVLAGATDAYASRSVSSVSESVFRPVGAIKVDDLRRGLTHAGAFARAADTYRHQQSRFDGFGRTLASKSLDDLLRLNPPTWEDPIDAAIARVLEVVDQDTSLVVQQQTAATFRAAEKRGLITGWTRIIHPELSEGGTCGLCIAAATRIYRTEELMAIHGRCKCVPAAVRGENAPGLLLNDNDLEGLYGDAGSTSGAALKRTRYRVDDHGHLGPVLVSADSKPTKTRAAAKRTPDKPSRTPEQVRANIQRLLEQQKAILPKGIALSEADPKKWGAYRQKLEARISDLEQQLATSS